MTITYGCSTPGLHGKLQRTHRRSTVLTRAYTSRQNRRSTGVENATGFQAQSSPLHPESVRAPHVRRTTPTSNESQYTNPRQSARTATYSPHSRANRNPLSGPREPYPPDGSPLHDSQGHRYGRQHPRPGDRWPSPNRRAPTRQRPSDVEGRDAPGPSTDNPYRSQRSNRSDRYLGEPAATQDGGGDGRQRRAARAPASESHDGTQISHSRRVALLRKPLLTAADKLGLSPEERARVYRALRTAKVRSPHRGDTPPWPPAAAAARRPGPLRVFCYGVDDVRLYRALEAGGALGRVVVVERVVDADAVLATRIKRTGKMVVIKEIASAARNAGKPFLELPTLSPQRVMEAVESLTGWPVPPHLTQRPPQPVSRLVPLDQDRTGAAAALYRLTGGLALHDFIASRAATETFPPALLRELDRTDVYDTSRISLLPRNPQEREAARQRPLARPYMPYSRMRRIALRKAVDKAQAETEGGVSW